MPTSPSLVSIALFLIPPVYLSLVNVVVLVVLPQRKLVLKPLPRPSSLAPAALTSLPPSTPPILPQASLLPSRLLHTPSCQSVSYENTSPLTVLSSHASYIHSYSPPNSPSDSSTVVTVYLDTRNNVASAGQRASSSGFRVGMAQTTVA